MKHAPAHFIKRRAGDVSDSRIALLDRFMLFIAVIGPASDIPQIYQIYTTHDASGVSLLTFTFYIATAVLWLVYALVHHQKPLILSSLAWMTTETIIVLGILLYG